MAPFQYLNLLGVCGGGGGVGGGGGCWGQGWQFWEKQHVFMKWLLEQLSNLILFKWQLSFELWRQNYYTFYTKANEIKVNDDTHHSTKRLWYTGVSYSPNLEHFYFQVSNSIKQKKFKKIPRCSEWLKPFYMQTVRPCASCVMQFASFHLDTFAQNFTSPINKDVLCHGILILWCRFVHSVATHKQN